MADFKAFEHLFLGRDPLQIPRHIRTIETINFHAGRYWPLEATLWDIIGKVCDQPVATLFGGAVSRIPAYASSGELKSPAAPAIATVECSLRAMKIRISRNRLDEGITAVQATCEAVGDGIDLRVNLNQMWRMSGNIEPALNLASARKLAASSTNSASCGWRSPAPSRRARSTLRPRHHQAADHRR
ncbi:hypothetical protein [Streptomyces sp. NPDC001635]